MVGRLVEDEQVRLQQQQTGGGKAGLFSARKVVGDNVAVIGGKAHAAQDGVDLHLDLIAVGSFKPCQLLLVFCRHLFILGRVVVDLCHLPLQGVHLLAQRQQVGKHRLHLLLDGLAVGKPAVLVQVADDLAVGQADRSLLIVQLAGQDVEQGGLSFPVGSHQTDAVLVIDGCTDVPQDAVRSVIFEYVFQ